MGLPDGVAAPITAQVRERVDEIIIRRQLPPNGIDAPEVFKITTIIHDGVEVGAKKYSLSPAERTALWDSLATLTFKNWILNQVAPQTDTPV